MGETLESETVGHIMGECGHTKTSKERRNGMWNIFEGIDSAVLEKLALSEEQVQQLVTEADDTVSECLSQLATLNLASSDSDSSSSCSCGGNRSRFRRSFSATVGEEMKTALQNRHRRNAVGNLFDVLTPSQKMLLVESLQAQLDQLNRCCCDNNANTNNSDIILSLSELSSPTTSPRSTSSTSENSSSSSSGSSSSTVSSPRSQGEIVCR